MDVALFDVLLLVPVVCLYVGGTIVLRMLFCVGNRKMLCTLPLSDSSSVLGWSWDSKDFFEIDSHRRAER